MTRKEWRQYQKELCEECPQTGTKKERILCGIMEGPPYPRLCYGGVHCADAVKCCNCDIDDCDGREEYYWEDAEFLEEERRKARARGIDAP